MIGTDIFVGENKGDSSSQSKRDALEQELVIITSLRIGDNWIIGDNYATQDWSENSRGEVP